MSEDAKELKKEHAKLKRQATEIASQIHDIVEDSLWSDYPKLEGLSRMLAEACDKANAFKKAHQL